MAFTKFIYNLINWKNKSESLTTPLGATNLNKMDSAIKTIGDNLNTAYDELSEGKLDKDTANTMISNVSYAESTGIFTITRLNGSSITIDTKLEKIVTNWKYDKDSQKLILTLDDGTTQEVDLSALITQYEFIDSDTIAFTIKSDGSVTSNVKDGSITEAKLQPNYLAEIKTNASNAETSAQNASDYADDASYDAKLAQSYAIGGSGIREDEADNAKYYMEKAKEYSQGVAFNVSYDNTNSGAESTNVQDAIDEIREDYMTKENPTGTGAFSMNRKADTDVGTKSSTLGANNIASGVYSHAQGYLTESSGKRAHTEGMRTEASGENAHAEGVMTKANGKNAHTEGESTIANGENSHAGGLETVAGYESQTVIGEYNNNKEEDIFEVGNGSYNSTNGTVRSNALELTREGDLKVAGGFKGNADSATKLATPRKINGVDFDGSKDITVSDRKYCIVGSDSTNSAGWYKFASGTLPNNDNINVMFGLTSNYIQYFSGILTFQARCENNTFTVWKMSWHTRIGFNADDVICVVDGMSYTLYVKLRTSQWGRIMIERLMESTRDKADASACITLHNNNVAESTEPVATNKASDGAAVLQAIQDANGNEISTNYVQKRSWYCNTKVGLWSRICSIAGTATGELLNVKFTQNNQASSYTYMIGTGYNSAYITQISASGFTANSNLQIRLTCDSTNKQLFYVEVLNEYGYNGATSVQAQCGIIDLNRYAISFDVTIYTDYTATVEADTVVAELISQPKGMVSNRFHGHDFYATTDVEEVVSHNVKNPLHDGSFQVNMNGNLGLYDITFSKWIVVSDKNGNVYLYGNADTATKAEQDGNGKVIADTYATLSNLNSASQNLNNSINRLDLNKASIHTKAITSTGSASFTVKVGSIIFITAGPANSSGNHLVIAQVRAEGVLSDIYKSSASAAISLSLSALTLSVGIGSSNGATITVLS